jgi:hypothetical protein
MLYLMEGKVLGWTCECYINSDTSTMRRLSRKFWWGGGRWFANTSGGRPHGAPALPTLPAVLFAIQCVQPRGTRIIRAPDSQCFCYFTCYYDYTDPSASLLADPTYVYVSVMIVIPYPILTENHRQRPVKVFTFNLSGVLTCLQCQR